MCNLKIEDILTNSMEQNPSSTEVNSSSASQQIPRIL